MSLEFSIGPDFFLSANMESAKKVGSGPVLTKQKDMSSHITSGNKKNSQACKASQNQK